MNTRSLFAAIFTISVIALPFHNNDAKAKSATKVVESFQTTLLNVMKAADDASVRQRYDILAPAISKHFHIPLMTQIVTGRYWSKAQPAEKASVIAAFKRINTATLAMLLDGYSGETFTVKGERRGPSKTKIISTHLVKTDKSTVKLDYVVGNFNEEWRLIDVVVDGGISELKVRRSEYRRILTKTGLPGLIRLLNAKANELMTY